MSNPKGDPGRVARALLGEGLLQEGGEVLGDAQGLDGDVDGGHAGGRARGTGEDHEVGHHVGVVLGHLVAVLLQRGLGRERLELLDTLDGDDGLRAAARGRAAAVGAHGDGLAVLGRDGEADLGEVGELLARGACGGKGERT
eukprot:scaffold17279_cov65-Phaeocystis_antarctica.AAC.4